MSIVNKILGENYTWPGGADGIHGSFHLNTEDGVIENHIRILQSSLVLDKKDFVLNLMALLRFMNRIVIDASHRNDQVMEMEARLEDVFGDLYDALKSRPGSGGSVNMFTAPHKNDTIDSIGIGVFHDENAKNFTDPDNVVSYDSYKFY